jgi:tetratricopeptide (TPR) repeat protein
VLDNASDAEQIRPLLPGTPGCMVVVTSRNRLTGLVASHGASPLALGLPTAAEARDMLTRRLGAGQVSADPATIEEIITRCDRLPLALAIVAARAATYSQFPLVTLARDLREAARSLDAFHTGDTTADVRAVFSWSYHKLGADAARLFRLLGLHPGPAVSVRAAASLAGLPSYRTSELLTELTRVHLLTEHAPGRYSLHDLLRTYATELAHGHDSPSERDAALHRMLDHYLHSAHAAAELLHPQRDIITLAPAEPGVTTETLPDMKAALAWLTAEHRTIVTADMLALRLGYDAHAWQLAWSMSDFLIRQCEWRDQLAMHGIAMRAAERLSQTDALAYAHRGLGLSNARLGQFDEALRQYQRALELFGQLGDHIGQGTTHINIGTLLDARGDHGDYAEALRHSQHAYDQYRAAGYQVGQARALNCIGMCRAKLGDFQQALPYCERALAVMRELGDAMGAAYTMDSLAYIHRGLGDRQQAIACYRQARDMFREAGEPEGEAEALSYIGDIHHDSDDPDAARDAWREALAILTQLNHPDAERLRAKLIS